MLGDPFLNYFALGLLIFVVIVIFYGIIAIHDIPAQIAEKRHHPHVDAIHAAGWVSLFTLHVLWPCECLVGALVCLLARQSDGSVSLLSRARISFPVLKKGRALFATATAAPVRGLRPVRASRSLTEKAPNPRSSTRSPRRRAWTISSNITLTIFSMSR
jgi:hypothetical protein